VASNEAKEFEGRQSNFNLKNTIKLHTNLRKAITQHNAQTIANGIQN
jgi:hypothetical protein